MIDLHYSFFIGRTSKKLKSALQKKLSQLEHNITVDQWLIIYVLHLNGEMSQTDLAGNTLKDSPAITRIVDHLLFKNYLLKNPCPVDRRSFKVSLSDNGKEVVEYMLPHLVEFRENGWKGLSEEDYHTLKRILNQVFHNY
ncbi:MAG TPA: MarR family transcriptional regulator [Chitinophagales bacterium]|nr:MarR family transcriptional regulator [Chitinophagales bacterium]